MYLSSVCLAVLAGWISSVHAQQFLAAKQSYDAMGLSDECTKVLNTELETATSSFLSCREELSTLRQKIIETCASSGDVMRHSGFELPAFYFADKFAYTYDINCYRHRSSGRFCDEVYSDWRDGKIEFDQCDDCYLRPLAAQISSPIGVSNFSVAHFEEVKAACPNAKYEVEVAKTCKVEIPVALKEDNRNCARWYTMKKGDTCMGIALSQNSSTVNLIKNNVMDVNCNAMPDEGTKLCLAEPCDTHTIRSGETCATISHKYGISQARFRALNTMIDETCSNIDRWEGYVACVGPTGFVPRQTLSVFKLEKGSNKHAMVVNGRALTDPDLVACGHVTDYNGVTIVEFWRLNPSLDKHKCFLKEEYSYCLAEEGGPRPQPQPGWDPRWGLRWG